jgi:hypothetical protein
LIKHVMLFAVLIILAAVVWMYRYRYEHAVAVNPTQDVLVRINNFTGETCVLDIGDAMSLPVRWSVCGK